MKTQHASSSPTSCRLAHLCKISRVFEGPRKQGTLAVRSHRSCLVDCSAGCTSYSLHTHNMADSFSWDSQSVRICSHRDRRRTRLLSSRKGFRLAWQTLVAHGCEPALIGIHRCTSGLTRAPSRPAASVLPALRLPARSAPACSPAVAPAESGRPCLPACWSPKRHMQQQLLSHSLVRPEPPHWTANALPVLSYSR